MRLVIMIDSGKVLIKQDRGQLNLACQLGVHNLLNIHDL